MSGAETSCAVFLGGPRNVDARRFNWIGISLDTNDTFHLTTKYSARVLGYALLTPISNTSLLDWGCCLFVTQGLFGAGE
jgi:hypothetical protein